MHLYAEAQAGVLGPRELGVVRAVNILKFQTVKLFDHNITLNLTLTSQVEFTTCFTKIDQKPI